VAQLAAQSGRYIARAIRSDLAHRPLGPFRYLDKGSMATIGRLMAVASIGRFEFSGVVAWWLWLMVHLLKLVGYRSRVSVLMEWAFAYFTWRRRSHVILEIPAKPPALPRPSMLGTVIRVPLAPGTRATARPPRVTLVAGSRVERP
jgi:NADH dehydrogenase